MAAPVVAATATAPSDTAEQPPCANLAVLTALVGNDRAVVAEVLRTFWNGAAESRAEMDGGIRTGALGAVADAVHKLKSGARAIGALHLGELCQAVEDAAHAGRVADVEPLMAGFVAELEAVQHFIDAATR